MATVEAIVAVGATPRFLDVDPDTLLVTAQGLSAGLTPRTAAVIVVHLYGQMPDMEALLAVSTKAGIELIEDAAQAHGAAWNCRRAGTWGRAGCFSFYPTKNLGALGDAGIVVTADDELAGRVRALANHDRPAGSWHSHRFAGGNSRLDSLQAALLSAKLPHLERWNRARRQAAAHYERLLVGMPVRPLSRPVAADSVHHLEVVRLDRRDVRTHLRARGVETGVHYPVPVHAQEAYSHFHTGPLLATEDAAKTVLSLPLFPDITGSQIEYVSQALAEATGGDPVGG